MGVLGLTIPPLLAPRFRRCLQLLTRKVQAPFQLLTWQHAAPTNGTPMVKLRQWPEKNCVHCRGIPLEAPAPPSTLLQPKTAPWISMLSGMLFATNFEVSQPTRQNRCMPICCAMEDPTAGFFRN